MLKKWAGVACGLLLVSACVNNNSADTDPVVTFKPMTKDVVERLSKTPYGGHCIVEFTVSKAGSVIPDSVAIVEVSDERFSKTCLKAASGFKYQPRIVDGVAVEVPNVQNKITFHIQND